MTIVRLIAITFFNRLTALIYIYIYRVQWGKRRLWYYFHLNHYTLKNKGASKGSSSDAIEEPFSQRFFKEPSLPYLFIIWRTFFHHKEPFVKQKGASDVKSSLWNHLDKKVLLMASWSTFIFKSVDGTKTWLNTFQNIRFSRYTYIFCAYLI